jgi:enamine deaminase RidA (YjgF/YER057c/UK114 family)
VFISGSLPLQDGQLTHKGKLGSELQVEDGYQAARQAVVTALGSLKGEIGSLDRVKRIVRVEGHVASAEGFTDQPKVVNGASELLGEIFGEAGRHARLAVGAAELPMGAAVEIALIVEVSDQ